MRSWSQVFLDQDLQRRYASRCQHRVAAVRAGVAESFRLEDLGHLVAGDYRAQRHATPKRLGDDDEVRGHSEVLEREPRAGHHG